MAGSYEIKKAANGQFHFNLKAGNGEIVLTSETYVTKQSAEAGIASVQTNCTKDDRYSKATATNGKFYFTLKAGNNQIIGNSQMYASEQTRDEGIASVKINGTTSVVTDKT